MSISRCAPFSKTRSARVIEKLFIHRDAIDRHLNAPMLTEREEYLRKLLESGYQDTFVADRASVLLNVVRLIDSASLGYISEAIIRDGAQRWVDQSHEGHTGSLRDGRCSFLSVARSWFKYLEVYDGKAILPCPIDQVYSEFSRVMRYESGYLPSTAHALISPIKGFLRWVSAEGLEICSIALADIDEFLSQGRAKGWQPRTIRGNCLALRSFFRFAESRGWSTSFLSKAIRSPSCQLRAEPPKCPSWKQLRSLLASLDDSNPSQCRAKAILLLASVYGLRQSEIVGLTLDDLDWLNEVITIRRSKRGRVQQFPLQFEVGEAIIRYLKDVRPPCGARELFVTLHRPYRPALNIGPAIRKVLIAKDLLDHPLGLHAFRHTCATELLRKGTSLSGIADFLGHRDIRSVSIYAHCDLRALREVAAFHIKGVL